MGCDIHIVIQRQEPDGTWVEMPYQEHYSFRGAPKLVDVISVAPEPFRSRNYDLFGILADVRNGRGFAGIATGDGWPSIAPDRGWPDGWSADNALVNPLWPEEGPRYMGEHSFTWVSLDELKAFEWDATISTLRGVVSAKEYEHLSKTGDAPTSYSGGISGPGIVVYNPEGYQEAKNTGRLSLNPYVLMSWPESARSATGDWAGKVIPWLDKLAAGQPLRLLLGFDS